MSRSKYTVRFLRIAEDDFSEIVTYIAVDRPSAAEALAAKIEKNFNFFPKIRIWAGCQNEDELARLHYRYLVVDNYLIFYTIEGQSVYIHRALRGARDYLTLF